MNKKLSFLAIASFLMLMTGFVALSVQAEENKSDKHDEDGGSHMREAKSIGSTLEVHVSDNGKVLVRGAKVTAISGNVVSAAVTWGSVSLNWNVVADANTQLVRRSGGASSIAEISVGDFMSFQGMLVTGVSSPLTVQAQVIKDWSVQRTRASFHGNVQSVDAAMRSFVLASEDKKSITVSVTSSTRIVKGDAQGIFTDIALGAKVTASGLYNNLMNKLEADSVKVHLAGAQRTTIEGIVKTVSASSMAPTTIVVTSGNTDYTVNVSIDTSVLNVLWLRLPIGSIRAGDKIRVYGTVNTNATVDATVVRDTSIRM